MTALTCIKGILTYSLNPKILPEGFSPIGHYFTR